MTALPLDRLTSARTPSIWFNAFVTLIAQCSQCIPVISIVFFPITGPSSFFFFILAAEQLPPAGHPTHFTPFLFALISYETALPITTARIMITIIFVINVILSFFNVKRRTNLLAHRYHYATYLATCKLYSPTNSLSDRRILHIMIAANTRTAIKPGINAVPREPVVTSVPI